MRFIGLISGGKDSFFNIHHCLSQGHELVALGNLHPNHPETDEIDSFMFQTVGHDIVEYYSKCLDVPLYRQAIEGGSSNQNLEYSITKNDEIEDLYALLSTIKKHHPDIEGVSCGAILSHYQRTRVENVCDRLGLTSLTYLWQRNQYELMLEMCQSGLDARIIKVAAIGLDASHLGKSITELFPHMIKINARFEVHICGEGGEFETIVLDSPFFKNKKLQIVESTVIDHSNDDVSYLKIKVELIDKTPEDFIPLEAPPLLSPEFEEIYDSLDSKPSLYTDIEDDKAYIAVEPVITHTASKIYVSNLTGSGESLKQQTIDVFGQLQATLAQHGLTFNNIQHMTLLLADMSAFAEINAIYSGEFADYYLPPSRICIQTELKSQVQVSCIVLKQQQQKTGIHIRSRSYWAPQNIGPYSQSIVETQDRFRLATLSGQIPLIPSNMELCQKDSKFTSVISLQHLHRVKELVNAPKIALLVCFVTDSNDVPVVVDTWKAYETENKGLLVTVQVNQLPKNADVEWGGLSYENIVGLYDDDDDDDDEENGTEVQQEVIRSQFDKYNTVEIRGFKVSTLFTNDPTLVKRLFGVNNGHITVICNQAHYKQLGAVQAEYLPVLRAFDGEGNQHNYAVIWKVEP